MEEEQGAQKWSADAAAHSTLEEEAEEDQGAQKWSAADAAPLQVVAAEASPAFAELRNVAAVVSLCVVPKQVEENSRKWEAAAPSEVGAAAEASPAFLEERPMVVAAAFGCGVPEPVVEVVHH